MTDEGTYLSGRFGIDHSYISTSTHGQGIEYSFLLLLALQWYHFIFAECCRVLYKCRVGIEK